jgi:GTPase SAR1 family protein
MKTPYNIDSIENSIRIILIGLDNGGKTSILTSLRGFKNLSAFTSLKPTRGEDWKHFEALNTKYIIYDLGGQKSFRDEYFSNFQRYLIGTKKIIYVIDVQDVNRYSEALAYLDRVIKSIDLEMGIEFSIFLHKYDPDIEFNQDLNDNVIDDLIRGIKEKIPPEFEYSIYKTSIYALFEKTSIS